MRRWLLASRVNARVVADAPAVDGSAGIPLGPVQAATNKTTKRTGDATARFTTLSIQAMASC
jgi:hypothetical protein